jgi:catechol 2,3-dioxygenase-like lactoylglutathione lyase family enzyme
MLKNSPFFASIAVDDVESAKKFYGETLDLFEVTRFEDPLVTLRAANGYAVMLYAKPGFVPAEHTVLNFPVDDIEATVDRMHAAGVKFEHYDDGPIATNEKGIAHPGHPGPKSQAWFRDPAGNILSVLEG